MADKPLEYPLGKFVPGVGKDVRVKEHELSRALQEKLANIEARLQDLENNQA